MHVHTYIRVYLCLNLWIHIYTHICKYAFFYHFYSSTDNFARPSAVSDMYVRMLFRSSNRMYSAHLPPRSIILFKNCTALSLKIHDEIKSSYHNVKRNKRYQVRGKWPFSLFQLYRMLIMD